MKKYVKRTESGLIKTAEEKKQEDTWLSSFIENLNKISVESRKSTIYNEVSSILGNKSKYSTVDEAVKDLQHRTGLLAYLSKISSNKTKNKTAEKEQKKEIANKEPEVFKKCPELKIFIENFVTTRPGVAIHAVVSSIPRSLKDKFKEKDLDDDVLIYINDLIVKTNKDTHFNNDIDHNLGKAIVENDVQENDDLFARLSPGKR